uniref:WxxW domain-containing protein n=1 Tax=Sinocyclocheilus anshuiensis TaxID=1608454 RepID=A0A671M7Z0_9TELE
MSKEFLPTKYVYSFDLHYYCMLYDLFFDITIFSVWYSSECVTRWFDSDDPTKGGDFELLMDLHNKFPGEICPNPIGIQAQTVSGQPANKNFVYFFFNDVRFTCPDEWFGFPLLECRTPWLDRDDPSGVGDYETLSLLLIKYPLQVCPKPIAIEVTSISGTPALPPGNIFVGYGIQCWAVTHYLVTRYCNLITFFSNGVI